MANSMPYRIRMEKEKVTTPRRSELFVTTMPKKKSAVIINNEPSVTSQRVHCIMTHEWNERNSSRALEMLQSGEGADCVIEVQEQQQNGDGPRPRPIRKCTTKNGQAGKGTQIRQQQQDEADKGNQQQQQNDVPSDPRQKRKYSSKIGQADKGNQQQQQDEADKGNQQQQQRGVVQIQTEEFNVHKYILIANSDVFSAMFSHKNTIEFREGRIIIKDSTIAAVRHMVHYMYTGKISDDYNREEDAIPLLTIAHKYQIKPLIYFNEQVLVESLTLENVFELVKFADIFQTEKLKSACAQVIWDDLGELKQGPEWMELKKNFPELAFYVVENFV